MKKLIIYSTLTLALAWAGCKKILDKVDFNGVPQATVWGNQSTANLTVCYIRKINILLSEIDQYGLTPDITGPIKAQAYFLRAWTYFQLMKVYGGIPYITSAQNWVT